MPKFIAIMILAALLQGCAYAMLAGHSERHVKIRMAESVMEGVSIQVGENGRPLIPDAQGIVELDLPAIPKRCETRLIFPSIALTRDPTPKLLLKQGDRILRRLSLDQVHQWAEEHEGPLELSVD